MLYLDASALMKLIRREPESDTLADWLDARASSPWVSSTLIEVELPRALRRVEPALLAAVPAIVARVARYEVDEVVRAAAAASLPTAAPGTVGATVPKGNNRPRIGESTRLPIAGSLRSPTGTGTGEAVGRPG